MNIDKLERAKDIKYLLSKLDCMEYWSRNKNTDHLLENGLYNLCHGDKEFSGKLHQLISDTKQRLQKEFDRV
ncbi:hypothetical protein DW657_17480 [Prevotella sp. AM23-5]|uniref:hypothetical protein n=1 Tax=Prevotella sp. AM23-5 TaxID=2292054 RepID=UPI000E524AA7|nr:hypothetical protein [Prevotella sp. AM23-5]RHN82918.1 hypothetical protein DW657_17480 [Prevotella sp. AM23-5]